MDPVTSNNRHSHFNEAVDIIIIITLISLNCSCTSHSVRRLFYLSFLVYLFFHIVGNFVNQFWSIFDSWHLYFLCEYTGYKSGSLSSLVISGRFILSNLLFNVLFIFGTPGEELGVSPVQNVKMSTWRLVNSPTQLFPAPRFNIWP